MQTRRTVTGCLLLSLLGILICGYMAFLHLGLLRGELFGGIGCGTSGVFNCHAVTGSKWGSFLGIPLALWGMIGYLAVFALSLLARHGGEWSVNAVKIIFLLAVIFLMLDVALAILMVFVIRFFCLFCLLTYGVNLGLLILSARSQERPKIGDSIKALRALVPHSQQSAVTGFWAIVLVGAIGVLAVHYATLFVLRGSPGAMREQLREYISRQQRVLVRINGHPMIGSPNAPIQIVEYSDFLCPACQRASELTPIILASHRFDAVFVFKHYPLDTTCNNKISRLVHPGACQLAAGGVCAHEQGRFWEYHDFIFERGPKYRVSDLEKDLPHLKLDIPRFQACLNSGKGMEAVKKDIEEGASIGVGSTPTYVVNGFPIAGGMNPAAFEDLLSVLKELN
ncbi:MAG: thioredoxin domain-containing protein [Candidatus Omnitrophica bacterium]|nr:thioredoxin domain-containing protein [Candidatus Omnitrophota bacterium]MBI2173994.1 thioredoxin domain-containing protein [Candidatus Omnitrophota bacterium]MBI3009990.1 thioredoxin domain-containing protein [Candidatus Omnitrophota bacterium]